MIQRQIEQLRTELDKGNLKYTEFSSKACEIAKLNPEAVKPLFEKIIDSKDVEGIGLFLPLVNCLELVDELPIYHQLILEPTFRTPPKHFDI